MKFLCPSCKAKYQIADDKVAGRSVRMKCRKCGHMIAVAKAVTEGSVSRKLESGSVAPPAAAPPAKPTSPAAATPKAPAAATPKAPAAAAPAKPKAPAPTAAPSPARAKKPPVPARAGATSPARPPVVGSPRPGTARAAPPPRPPVAPKPPWATKAEPAAAARATPPAKAVAAKPALRATPAAAPTPAPAVSGDGSAARALSPFAEEPELGHYDADDDEATRVVAGIGALAGAFSQAVGAPESSSLISTPADEWYAGINGVPVGPMRLTELRSKAASGAVGLDSLVWREGFEQWQPLRTFPELVAVLEEGVSSARASVAPLTPPSGPQPAASSAAGFGASVQPAGVLADPFAAPTVEKAELPDFVLPRRRGTGAAAWIAVVVALLFGLTIGFVLFSREKPEPIVKIVEVPAKVADPGARATEPAASSTETEAVEVPGDPAGGKTARVGGPLPTKAPDKAPDKPGTGLSGLKGLSGVSGEGPSASPGSAASQGSGSGQLDSDQVQRTVSRYTSSVRRSCWQPALDTRAPDAPSSARVSVAITVSPSGSVSGATTSGDPKGYRGLASCIGARVRGWQFPASSGTTTVNVPFYFAAQ